MEVKELIKATRGLRVWGVLAFTVLAFLSLQNANPPIPEMNSLPLVASR